jgi:hypothetical protein
MQNGQDVQNQGNCWSLNAGCQDKLVLRNSSISQNLLVVEAKINNQKLDILIDSGSNRTVISDMLAAKLGVKVMPVPDSCGATGIGGRIQFIGRAEIELSIAGSKQPVTAVVAKHDQIFHSTVFMALVGYGALKKFPPITIDARNDRLIMNGMQIPIGDPRANGSQIFKLHADNAVTLKAGMSTKISVTATGTITTKPDGLLVEEVSPALAEQHIDVVQSVIMANTPSFIFLNNPTQNDVQLYAGTTIAKAKPIRNGQKIQNGKISFADEIKASQDDTFIGLCQGFC